MTLGLLLALALAGTTAQEQKTLPAFPARAEAVTLDVVVLDKQGRPVRGLTAADFAVLEEGRPQAAVAFEAFDLSTLPPEPAALTSGPVATNIRPPDSRPGRAFVFVVDDLGLDPIRGAVDTKKAIARWLEEKAAPSDEVTIVNTSGDVYWSDRVAKGRADLLGVLASIEGHRPNDRAMMLMSDWEAYQITEYDGRQPSGAPSSAGSGPPGGVPLPRQAGIRTILDRVVERFVGARECPATQGCGQVVRVIAMEMYDRTKRRARALLGTVERVSAGLASWRGRKSILIFSEGFIRDTSLNEAETAIRASQLGNTAVYFIDARGLVTAGLYKAESSAAPNPSDIGALTIEEAFVATAGGEYLAEATGGSVVRNTNDLTEGLDRVLDESAVYYLLGYQPEKAPDGRWRKLTVKVGRPGLTVRARRGYYAPSTVTAAKAKASETEQLAKTGLLTPSLAVGGERDQILLRLAAEPAGPGEGELVRVLVGLEVDTSGLVFTGTGASRTATVELTLASVSRERPKVFVLEDRAEITASADATAAPWTFTRELSVPLGVTQLRMQVKDVASGHVGSVRGRVEVRPGQAGTPVGEGGEAADPPPGFLTRDLPILAALEAGTVPSVFEHRADVLHFEPQGHERDALLVVSLPRDAVDLQLDESGNVYRGRLEVVAFVTDDKGRLLVCVRQEWPVERLAENGGLRPADDPFFQAAVRLTPGHLTLTSLVRDLRTGRRSASRRPLDIPPAPLGPALSSLVLLERGEPVSGQGPVAPNPLQVEAVRFVPSLRRHIAEGTSELPFLFRTYDAAGADPPPVAVEVRQGQRTVVRASPTVPAVDREGHRTWLGSVPTAALAVGRYEVRVIAGPGEAAAQETAAFDVEPRPRAAAAAAGPAPPSADLVLAAILEKAGEYVVDYGQAFRDIVAEETYMQWAGGREQHSRSDLVFVSIPGAIPWTCFRDVFEVDGQRVRDRESRLEKLFLAESRVSAEEKANTIIAESARYNFGWAHRTINVPTLPLLFLHPANQERFRFERKGHRRFGARDTVEIALVEIGLPTLVNDGGGGDVPASGRVFVDLESGAVLRTDITFRFIPDRGLARLATEYRFDHALDLWLPAEMKEVYRNLAGAFLPVFRGDTEATARYAKYRRFGVTTEERVALPAK